MSNETNNNTPQSVTPANTIDSVQAAPANTVTTQTNPSAESQPSSPLAQIQTAPSKMHLEFSEKQVQNQETRSPVDNNGSKEE